MRDNDQQLGKPMRAYRDTKANIQALGLGAADEGCEAYATNTDEFGTFDGAAWVWGVAGGDHGALAGLGDDDHTQYIKDSEFTAITQVLVGTGAGTFKTSKQVYDVTAFGATGVGEAHDDRPHIQAAIDAADAAGGGIVFLPTPPNYYYVEQVGNGDNFALIMANNNVDFIGTGYGCRIQAKITDDTGYAIIVMPPTGLYEFSTIANLHLFFDGTASHPNATKAAGIAFLGDRAVPDNYRVQNVVISDGYYGVFNETDGWGGIYSGVRTLGCRNGFYHSATSTTATIYEQCYVKGTDSHAWDMRAFELSSTKSEHMVLIAFAVDHFYPASDKMVLLKNCHGLAIDGLHIELCKTQEGDDDACLVWIETCRGFSIDGFASVGNFLNPAAGEEASLVYINESTGTFKGCALGGAGNDKTLGDSARTGNTVKIGGDGGTDSSKIHFSGSKIELCDLAKHANVIVYSVNRPEAGGEVVFTACDVEAPWSDPHAELKQPTLQALA